MSSNTPRPKHLDLVMTIIAELRKTGRNIYEADYLNTASTHDTGVLNDSKQACRREASKSNAVDKARVRHDLSLSAPRSSEV